MYTRNPWLLSRNESVLETRLCSVFWPNSQQVSAVQGGQSVVIALCIVHAAPGIRIQHTLGWNTCYTRSYWRGNKIEIFDWLIFVVYAMLLAGK